MHKKKWKEFLDGNLDFEDIQKIEVQDEENRDFMHSYRKLIAKSNAKVPNFDPFEKVKSEKIRRLSNMKRISAYAATIVLLISLFIAYQQIQPLSKKNSLSAQELNELKINTEQSLLMFSKELNACITEINKEQKARQSFTDLYSINHFKIDFDNPTNNIKIN